ncbi:MAG TPA: RNA-directed DNA polymerase [Holophagaceae bacterium]|nr:RNA-directed DNA polymerase [Holophagaceae bacterium]
MRNQLRNMDIKDLYDHYDFNFNIEDRIQAIRASILDGSYSVGTPLIYKTEKKFGICRHMIIPQPEEALILQCLIEQVSSSVLKKQPSKNAFYSRDKHNVKKPHEAVEYGMSFREQWKILQRQIYNFTDDFDYLVVTDLTNYFDSIDLRELRRVFVSHVETDEVIIDLIFRVVEGLSWKPDYLPYSHRGLPTANIEPIRLLAHSFLFEIDQILKERTSENFARWMDDITCGINDKRQGIALLSDVSDVLKSRGLALNLSKTQILSAEEAHFHFQVKENLEIDAYEALRPGTKQARTAERELWFKYKAHFRDRSPKAWDKIAKRYITTFGKLQSDRLLVDLPSRYISNPALRSNYLIYLSVRGYSQKAANCVLHILNEIDPFDDLSLFQISNLITQWAIPLNKRGNDFIQKAQRSLAAHSARKKDAQAFFALLWFKSKYEDVQGLQSFLVKYRNIWQNNSFLRRQATAAMARFCCSRSKKRLELLNHQAMSGVPTTVSVANQITQFGELTLIPFSLNAYLFPTTKPAIYPHSKFVVLCSVLASEPIRNDAAVLSKIAAYITDPQHLSILTREFNLSLP